MSNLAPDCQVLMVQDESCAGDCVSLQARRHRVQAAQRGLSGHDVVLPKWQKGSHAAVQIKKFRRVPLFLLPFGGEAWWSFHICISLWIENNWRVRCALRWSNSHKDCGSACLVLAHCHRLGRPDVQRCAEGLKTDTFGNWLSHSHSSLRFWLVLVGFAWPPCFAMFCSFGHWTSLLRLAPAPKAQAPASAADGPHSACGKPPPKFCPDYTIGCPCFAIAFH